MNRACTLSLCFGVAVFGTAIGDDLPNVVVILADDMGYGDVSHLNPDSTIPTPNLNRLAQAGMTFLDAHSPSAVCTPTRYGLLTGRYCWRSKLKQGVLGGYSEPLLEPGRRTLANLLKDADYQTAAIGKWHLGMALPTQAEDLDSKKWDGDPGIDFLGTIADSPIHHGFDNYFGVSASLDMAPYVYVRNDRFTQEPSLQQEAVEFPHYIRPGPRAADFIVDEALDRLTEEATQFIAEAAKSDNPFFLYLPLTGPHKPTQPHARFRGKTSLSEYGDFVHQVDWTVGNVLDAIEATGESDNTLVVFTSDNGSYMYRYDEADTLDHVDDVTLQGYRPEHHRANGPLRGTKADVWEAGHRVPTFIRWPREIDGAATCQATICLVDLYATIAEIVGADLAEDEAEDSISLVKLVSGESATRGTPVIHHSANGMFAIRDGKWKLIAGNGSGGRQLPKGKPFEKPYQLYDVQQDLGELHDVAARYPEVVMELSQKLDSLRDQGRSRP